MHNYDTSQCLYFPGLVHSLEVVGSWQLAPQHFLHEVVEVSSVESLASYIATMPALAERKGRLVIGASLFPVVGIGWGLRKNPANFLLGNTLQGTNISHLGKGKIIFKHNLGGDMLVPRRVIITILLSLGLYLLSLRTLVFQCKPARHKA